jgi:hypothetical protein
MEAKRIMQAQERAAWAVPEQEQDRLEARRRRAGQGGADRRPPGLWARDEAVIRSRPSDGSPEAVAHLAFIGLLQRVVQAGMEQLSRNLDAVGQAEGWLLIFDQRPGRTWEERLWSEERLVGGRTLHLRGA